jgi:uncharacterized protein
MKILLAGGTGFIGRELLRALLKERHYVILLSRKAHVTFGIENFFVETVWWDGKSIDPHKTDLSSIDVIINLGGASIADKRWTRKQKKLILESRIESTRALVELVSKLDDKPKTFISASAIGYYGDVRDKVIDESAAKGSGFLSDVCELWEQEAAKVRDYGVKLTTIRTGIVLGADGGVLKKMYPIFKRNFGAILGSGDQGFSWIHLDDVLEAILFIMKNKIEGVVNLTAPNPVDMKEFSYTLAKVMNKKCRIKIPPLLLKLGLGELAETILNSQKVIPQVLMNKGFPFKYRKLEAALEAIVSGR